MRIQQQSPFATDKSRCLASAFWLALLPAQYWCLSIRHAASSPLLLSMAPLHSLNANVYVVKYASGREPIHALRAVPCRAERRGTESSVLRRPPDATISRRHDRQSRSSSRRYEQSNKERRQEAMVCSAESAMRQPYGWHRHDYSTRA